MRSSPFWDVTQRRLVVTDVSGHLVWYLLLGSSECGNERLSRSVSVRELELSSRTGVLLAADMIELLYRGLDRLPGLRYLHL
jgi:hypothetical protein